MFLSPKHGAFLRHHNTAALPFGPRPARHGGEMK
jgi:hypothetical protein